MGGWANAMRERKKEIKKERKESGKMNLETWAYATGERKKRRSIWKKRVGEPVQSLYITSN